MIYSDLILNEEVFLTFEESGITILGKTTMSLSGNNGNECLISIS